MLGCVPKGGCKSKGGSMQSMIHGQPIHDFRGQLWPFKAIFLMTIDHKYLVNLGANNEIYEALARMNGLIHSGFIKIGKLSNSSRDSVIESWHPCGGNLVFIFKTFDKDKFNKVKLDFQLRCKKCGSTVTFEDFNNEKIFNLLLLMFLKQVMPGLKMLNYINFASEHIVNPETEKKFDFGVVAIGDAIGINIRIPKETGIVIEDFYGQSLISLGFYYLPDMDTLGQWSNSSNFKLWEGWIKAVIGWHFSSSFDAYRNLGPTIFGRKPK